MARKSEIDCIAKMAQECLGFRLRKLNRVISGYYDESLRPFGIKLSQMNILIIVTMMKQAKPADICNYAQVNVSTLSRNAERMHVKGWLKYCPGENRRAHLLAVTSKGRKLLNSAYPAWKKAQQKTKSLLGKELSENIQQLDEKLSMAAKNILYIQALEIK